MKPANIVIALFCLAMPLGSLSAEEKAKVPGIGPDGVQRVELVGGSYWFEPGHVIVKKGVPVEFVAKEAGGSLASHTLVMDRADAGMDFKVELGPAPKTVRFTPEKTGKFPFYCDVDPPLFPSHRERGMEGTLEVVEELPAGK